MQRGTLILEDDSKFNGFVFGASTNATGEVVFQTGMVGYTESLTNSSYCGKILVLTFPVIGNYGVPDGKAVDDFGILRWVESNKIYASGLIVSAYTQQYSHWNAIESLSSWLKKNIMFLVFMATTMAQYQPTVLITTQQAHPWTISVFNGLNGNVLLTFKSDAPVARHGLLCSRDHIYAAAIDRPSIYVWKLNSRNRDYKKITVAGPINSMIFIRDSTILACAIGNKIFLYKLDNGQHLITLSAHIRTINHLLFDEDQDCLISVGEDNLIHRWNIEEISPDRNLDISPSKSFQGHTGPIHDLCQISIGKFHLLLTASSDLSVRLWDIVTGKCLCTFLFPNEIHSICASSFSTTIYCGTDTGTIFIVPLQTLTTQFGGIQHQNPTITIDNNNSKQLNHHQGSVISLRLSADEQILYSGSLDKDCVMWDLSSGQIRFKKSCSSPVTNILLAKIDTDDINEGSTISIPFSNFSNETHDEVVSHTIATRNGSMQRPISDQDSIKFIPMPPVNGESDESASMAAPTFVQMARLLLEQQMNSS